MFSKIMLSQNLFSKYYTEFLKNCWDIKVETQLREAWSICWVPGQSEGDSETLSGKLKTNKQTKNETQTEILTVAI